MTITLDTEALAQINSPVRGACWLVDLDFVSGTIRYTNSPIDIVASGHTYTGYSNLVNASALTESESNSAEKVTLGFTVVNQAMLAATLGNVDNYRGKPVRMYLQLTNDRFVPVGAPVKRWAGYMDKVAVTRNKSNQGPSNGVIELACSRAGMARARTYQGRRLSNTQQQQRFPNDRGLEYLQHLIEQPARWLSIRFQQI